MLMMPQFGKEHTQVYALKRQAQPDKRSPVTFTVLGSRRHRTDHFLSVFARAILRLSQLAISKTSGRDIRDGGLTCFKAIEDPRHVGCGHHLHPHSSLSSRDRFRTMTNVLGDALAAGIVAHVCEKDFAPKPPKVCTACLGEQGNSGNARTMHRHDICACLRS